MPVKASTSTIKWCRDEVGPIFNGLRLIFRSQLGYEGRAIEQQLYRACLRVAVGGGTVVDPFSPKTTSQPPSLTLPEKATDVLQRAKTIAVGIRTYAELMAKGISPGSGGYTISESGEKIYSHNQSPARKAVDGLSRVAELVSRGVLSLPNFRLPNLERLGETADEKPLFKDSDFARTPSRGSAESMLDSGLTPEEQEFLLKAARSVDDLEAEEKLRGKKKNNIYRPVLPENYTVDADEVANSLSKSKESKVPSSRIGRYVRNTSFCFYFVLLVSRLRLGWPHLGSWPSDSLAEQQQRSLVGPSSLERANLLRASQRTLFSLRPMLIESSKRCVGYVIIQNLKFLIIFVINISPSETYR